MKATFSISLLAGALTLGALAACTSSSETVARPGDPTNTDVDPTESDSGGGPSTPGPTGEDAQAPTKDGGGGDAAPLPVANMKALALTSNPQVVAALTAGGLDINNLPPTLGAAINTSAKRNAVMKSFTIALGVQCTGCHAMAGGQVDPSIETPQKRVARKMWSEFVAKLQKKDGGAIYCDNCHQGAKTFIDRVAPTKALETWMRDNFAGQLKRKDGQTHTCATCHGTPFSPSIIDKWEAE